MGRDLSIVCISRTPKRMREDEVEEDSCGSCEAFGFPDRGGSEGDRERLSGKNVKEIEGSWRGVSRE